MLIDRINVVSFANDSKNYQKRTLKNRFIVTIVKLDKLDKLVKLELFETFDNFGI